MKAVNRPEACSDAELVAMLRAGQAEAVDILVTRYQAPLLGYSFRLLADRPAAEDVVQETMIKLLAHLNDLRDANRLRSYLYQIATRLCRDYQRRPSRREISSATPVVGRDKIAPPQQPVERFYVASLLRSLHPQQAEVLVLRYYEDMDLATIAAVLEVPVGTVKSRLHTALRRLRRQLATDSELLAIREARV